MFFGLYFLFNSTIHLELFYINYETYVSFFMMDIWLFQHYLLKSVFFLHWSAFDSSLNINQTSEYGFISKFLMQLTEQWIYLLQEYTVLKMATTQ